VSLCAGGSRLVGSGRRRRARFERHRDRAGHPVTFAQRLDPYTQAAALPFEVELRGLAAEGAAVRRHGGQLRVAGVEQTPQTALQAREGR
jgi:hypothetical protein